jgi:hypothetical protein
VTWRGERKIHLASDELSAGLAQLPRHYVSLPAPVISGHAGQASLAFPFLFYLAPRMLAIQMNHCGRPNGLVLAPWSGAPNQFMTGGPPSHSAIKRGWGPRLAVRGSPRRHIPHPTNPNPTRGSTEAAGSSATAAAEAFLLDPTYTVSPPDAQPHRPRHRRPRAATASPASSRGRPYDHDLQDGV